MLNPDSDGARLWKKAMGEGVAGWGPVEREALSAYLVAASPAADSVVSRFSSWTELAAIDALLDEMSFYSAYRVPLLRLAVGFAERLGDADRAGLIPKLLGLAGTLHERCDLTADDAARQAVERATQERGYDERNLAKILSEAARFASPSRAVEYLTQALAIEGRFHPQTSEPVLALRGALARRLIQIGRTTEGRRLCMAHVDACAAAFGAESAEAASALDWTARVLIDEPDVIDFARRALVLRERILGDHAETARSLVMLAQFLEGVGAYAEAEPLLLRAAGIHERLPCSKDDLDRVNDEIARFRIDRLRWEARGREWEHAIALANARTPAGGSPFDLAVDSLLQAVRIFTGLSVYTLSCEAAVLLAGAGRVSDALTLARTDLSDTPSRWDAAAVYVAIAGWHVRRGDQPAAIDVLRAAAATAQAIASIYERGDPYPAVYDLLEVLEMAGLARLAGDVVIDLDPCAIDVFEQWRQESKFGGPYPERPDDRVALAAVPPVVEPAKTGRYDEAIDMATGLTNTYAALGSLIAIARIAAGVRDADTCERALLRGLDLLIEYSGEEADRTLNYHEDYRFTAAHGLGMAARQLLGEKMRLGFARAAFARCGAISDILAGAGAMVAAGEATRPFLDLRQHAALQARRLTVADWDILEDAVVRVLVKHVEFADLILALHGEAKSVIDKTFGQFGMRAQRLLQVELDAVGSPDPAQLAAARDRIDQIMRQLLVAGDLPLAPAEIDRLVLTS